MLYCSDWTHRSTQYMAMICHSSTFRQAATKMNQDVSRVCKDFLLTAVQRVTPLKSLSNRMFGLWAVAH